MRLAFIVNSLAQGGAERHTVQLANALAVRGHEVALAYLDDRDDLLPYLHQSVRSRTARIDRKGPIDVVAMLQLRRFVRATQADIVFVVNEYPLAMVFASTWPLSRPPVVVAVNHSSTLGLHGADHGARGLSRLDALWRRQCDAVVLLSEKQRTFWCSVGRGHTNEWVIPNGIDPQRFRPGNRAARSREGGVLRVAMVAVMRPEKRHDLLLRAAATVRRRGVDIAVTLIGDGTQRAAIEALATELGVRQCLEVTGFTKEPEKHLAQADVACLVSDTETFSLALLEAMAMGKAVVATDVGAASEILTSGVNGIVVPAGAVDAIANALMQLTSAALRARLGAAARETVLRHYTEDVMVDRYGDLIESLRVQTKSHSLDRLA